MRTLAAIMHGSVPANAIHVGGGPHPDIATAPMQKRPARLGDRARMQPSEKCLIADAGHLRNLPGRVGSLHFQSITASSLVRGSASSLKKLSSAEMA